MDRLVVGLTGTFGSGKSTVGRLLKRFGAQRVIDCDRLVEQALRVDVGIRAKIRDLFDIKGRINRQAIAEVVFRNIRKRKQLEAIIHPYVFKAIDSDLRRIPKGIVILEVPLLFETGFDRRCDMAMAVAPGKRAIVDRLRRLGFEHSEIEARMRAQWTEHRKKRSAGLWISNSGSKQELVRRTKSIWKKVLTESNQGTMRHSETVSARRTQ